MTVTEDATHFYLSTACLHGEHVHCRLACKFCGSECQCTCHPRDSAAPAVDGPTSAATESGRSVHQGVGTGGEPSPLGNRTNGPNGPTLIGM